MQILHWYLHLQLLLVPVPTGHCNHSNGSGGGFSLCMDQTVAADGISREDYPDRATVAEECRGESTLTAQAEGNPKP